VAEEFVIKSQAIEDKIKQLLPSQGGFAPGVDFSASTMVMPIIDLTETAEGSQVRQDLQISSSLNRNTAFSVQNTTTTVINTTGYYLIHYASTIVPETGVEVANNISITDGISTKKIIEHKLRRGSANFSSTINDKITLFLDAGDSITVTSSSLNSFISGSAVQVADLQGNLTQVS